MYSAKLSKDDSWEGLTMQVPGLVDKSPNVLKGDTVCIYAENDWWYLEVQETYKTQVYFRRVRIRSKAN